MTDRLVLADEHGTHTQNYVLCIIIKLPQLTFNDSNQFII